MRFKGYLTVILALFLGLQAFAQNKVTVSGTIKDSKNGEDLIGAIVFVKGTTYSAQTNVYGFYSISLPAGKQTISYMSVGYTTIDKEVDLTENTTLNIELTEETTEIKEVIVTTEQEDKNVKSIDMSVNKIDIKLIEKIPALLGEVDVVRAIQLLPGVTTVGEGASGFNVRGGNVDGNLILLDEAPVFNSSHLFGFFSVFNPDAVKDVKLIKGGIPAQYGGRISSILDIRMKEGNKKQFELNGGIGTIFSRLSIEAPFVKDKGSFIVAARRSYIDVLAKPFLKGDLKKAKFNFYDLTAKTNYKINDKNNVYLSGYLGKDVFGAGFKFNWGNATTTARWNHLFNQKLFMNNTAYYSNYTYNIGFKDESNGSAFDWNSNIINYSYKNEFIYYVNNKNTMHIGGQTTLYEFRPGTAIVTTSSGTQTDVSLDKKYGLESAIFVDNEQKTSGRFSFQYGLRGSTFNYMGKGYAYTYYDTIPNEHKRLKEEKYYGKWKSIKQYFNIEPRASMKIDILDVSSVKVSYNRTTQYLHLVSNTAASTPLDVWTPVTNNLKPQIADQVAAGYFHNFKNNMYETSVELYYKKMQNQLDYVDNANLLLNKYLEGDLLQGLGRAYGAEFFVKKTKGKFTGWISYTLARTERKVIGLSNDTWFRSKYNRTHNANVVAVYEPNKRWSFSGNFVFQTGTPATFFTDKYQIQGYTAGNNATNERNNYVISPYNRLDFSATWDFKKNDTRKWKSSLVFSVYNMYNRKNAFTIFFRPNKDNPENTEAVRYSVVGTVIPAITYNFKF